MTTPYVHPTPLLRPSKRPRGSWSGGERPALTPGCGFRLKARADGPAAARGGPLPLAPTAGAAVPPAPQGALTPGRRCLGSLAGVRRSSTQTPKKQPPPRAPSLRGAAAPEPSPPPVKIHNLPNVKVNHIE